MRILLVESVPDAASVGIRSALETLTGFTPTNLSVADQPVLEWSQDARVVLVRCPRLHLEAEPFLNEVRQAGVRFDVVVFLSKHKAASGKPSLTVHPVGNFGDADFGGVARTLGPTSPPLQTALLRALHQSAADADYASQATFEVTHHGPLNPEPCCFLELGSTPKDWSDPAGAQVVARALLGVLESRAYEREEPVLVGLGGGHYAPRFTEAALTRPVHYGHLIPAYAAKAAPDAVGALEQAWTRTPDAKGLHVHVGTMPADTVARWLEAARTLEIPVVESVSAWLPSIG